MDAILTRRLMEATQTVFGTMLGSSVTFGAPGLGLAREPDGEICGVLSFSGNADGAATFCLPVATANNIFEALCAEPADNESEDSSEVVNEITSLIGSRVQSKSSDEGVALNCSLVASGDPSISGPENGTILITVPCDTPHGKFDIFLQFLPADSSDRTAAGVRAAAG